METTTATINLEDYRAVDKARNLKAKVFTGRDRGAMVRKESNINLLMEKYDSVEIIIPNDIYSINPSFFEELFFTVVTKLGKERFMSKIKLVPLGEYTFDEELVEAVDRILSNTTAIG